MRRLLIALAILMMAGSAAQAAGTVSGLPAAAEPLGNSPDAVMIDQGSGCPTQTAPCTTSQAPSLRVGQPFQSATAPTTPFKYQLWWDTSTTPPTLRIYDGSQWVQEGTLDTTGHLFSPALVNNAGVPVDIRIFGAKCDWNGATGTDDTTAIQAAINWAQSQVGSAAALTGPIGRSCAISATLNITKPFVYFGVPSGIASLHDVAPTTGQAALGLAWTGAAGGTMMLITPGGAQVLVGNVIEGLSFLCRSTAAIGLQVASVRNGRFDLYEEECTSSGMLTTAVPLGENSDFLNNNIRIVGRQIDKPGFILNMTGIATANSDFNYVIASGSYSGAAGLRLGNAANNLFFHPRLFGASPPAGVYGVDCGQESGAVCSGNYFVGLSATSIFRGTDTQGLATVDNMIFGVDEIVASPVVGTGAQVSWARQSGVTSNPPYGILFTGIPASGTPGLVATEQVGNTSLCHAEAAALGLNASMISCNGSQASLLALTDGTNRFRWRFTGSALSLDRLGGSYPVQLPTNTQIGSLTAPLRMEPIAVPTAPLTGYQLYTDQGDNRLKAMASNGIVAVLATPNASTLGACAGLGATGTCSLVFGSNEFTGNVLLTPAGAGPLATGTVIINFSSNIGQNGISCTLTPAGGGWVAPATISIDVQALSGFTLHWTNGGANPLVAGTSYFIDYQCRGF